MKQFLLIPRDLLFMRDARPMAASDAGLGANWPRPDQLWNAVINAFHRAWPQRQLWEGVAHTVRSDENQNSSFRFGALRTMGPFPCKNNETYLPFPLDWNMEIVACTGTDLPVPLTHAFRAKKVGKTDYPQWLSAAEYGRYLANESFEPANPELYDEERQIGIAIAPETQTTVEGQLYQAAYLRLRKEVTMVFTASCDIHPKGGTGTVDVFLQAGAPNTLILGGQQGVAGLQALGSELGFPHVEITTRYLRWTLLAPSVWNAGWHPDWITEKGEVMLPRAVRTPEMSRLEWKELSAKSGRFTVKLIAARIGKPMAFSGWDLQTGPKPTQLAVPAGSTFVFDCATVEEATALATALHYTRPRSTVFGEKGFGLGICSSVTVGAGDSGCRTQDAG